MLLNNVNSQLVAHPIALLHLSAMEKKSTLTDWQAADAERLNALFKKNAKVSQAEFGDRYSIGTQGMVWQYLNGRRALNLKAAAAFARGLNVDVADFSPTLAASINKMAGKDFEFQEVRAPYAGLTEEKKRVLVLWDQLLSGQRAEHLARLEFDARQAAGIVDEVRQRFANLPSRAATPEQQPVQAPSSADDRSGNVVNIPPASARPSQESKLIPWAGSKPGKKGKKK